jgi:hypothetical protein
MTRWKPSAASLVGSPRSNPTGPARRRSFLKERLAARDACAALFILCALEQPLLFGVDRATGSVAKLFGQYVAEFTANLAFHFVALTAVVGGNHDVQQIGSSFGDSLADHFRYFGVKEHLCCTLSPHRHIAPSGKAKHRRAFAAGIFFIAQHKAVFYELRSRVNPLPEPIAFINDLRLSHRARQWRRQFCILRLGLPSFAGVDLRLTILLVAPVISLIASISVFPAPGSAIETASKWTCNGRPQAHLRLLGL